MALAEIWHASHVVYYSSSLCLTAWQPVYIKCDIWGSFNMKTDLWLWWLSSVLSVGSVIRPLCMTSCLASHLIYYHKSKSYNLILSVNDKLSSVFRLYFFICISRWSEFNIWPVHLILCLSCAIIRKFDSFWTWPFHFIDCLCWNVTWWCSLYIDWFSTLFNLPFSDWLGIGRRW